MLFIWPVRDIGKKMIPRFKPDLGWAELKAALSWPSKNDIEKFEENFAKLMDQKHALAFPYGRTALLFLLEALDIKNKEVICPAYTCVVVAHAIVKSGNIPVFVDCGKDGYNMDLELAEKTITKNTAAIIATSLFGNPVNLDQLEQIRIKYPYIKIIQDCAHSFSAQWKNRPVQKEGIAAIYGLNISKIITSIFGGMITTDDSQLYGKLQQNRKQHLKDASIFKSIRRFLYLIAVYCVFNPVCYSMVYFLIKFKLLSKWTDYYDEKIIDMPQDYLEQMTELEARVGMVQVEKYKKIIENRIVLAKKYIEYILDKKITKSIEFQEGSTYSHFVFNVEYQEDIVRLFIENKVELGKIVDYAIPNMIAYKNYISTPIDNSKYFVSHVINLPIYLKSKKQILKVLNLLSLFQSMLKVNAG